MVIALRGRNRGRQRATVTKTMMMMIKITFFFFSPSLLVINCEPLAVVVDLSLIGRAAVWGVNRGYLCCSLRALISHDKKKRHR